jgi:hypothetical protein
MPEVMNNSDNWRALTTEDFKGMDVEDQEGVTWAPRTAVEVSEAAKAALLEKMPDEFGEPETEAEVQPAEATDEAAPAEGETPAQ